MIDVGAVVQVETQLVTFEEFEALPDPPSGHYELHHGQVILMPPRKFVHMTVQQTIFNQLAPSLHGLGFLTLEFAFRPAAEYECWQCDIGFVSQSRCAAVKDYFLGAPDLVIEVLSKSNTVDDMLDRQDVCLNNGCISFWVVDPKRRTAMVTTPDGNTIKYGRDTVVPLPAPYQGSISVAAIFS